LTGGRCSEVDLVLKLLGRDLEWSLLTGGRYSEVVVNTGLTVYKIEMSVINKMVNVFVVNFISGEPWYLVK
jgi:hypothetical protein